MGGTRLCLIGALTMVAVGASYAGVPAHARGRQPELNADVVTPDGIAWRRITAGAFQMGCVPDDTACRSNEQPRHSITLTRPFDLMETEVTVRQFRAWAAAGFVRPPRQPSWNNDDHPVVNVTWEEMRAFCRGIGGRLPTEAEWELAARGGGDGAVYPWGSDFDPGRANGIGRAGNDVWMRTAPVGSFPPNAFGLRDMIGNVWEWVEDWYWPPYFARSPPEDPAGPRTGRFRALRGGSWDSEPEHLRTSFRFRLPPAGRYPLYIGGRCARSPS